MLARLLAKRSRNLARLLEHQCRNTWVLRRMVVPERTPDGQFQRNPEELPELMRYEVVENENERDPGPLKVILLEDVEGIGNQFDVVDVDRQLARNELILGRKAVYASPFDLQYYGELKEKMKDELAKRVRIPYEYLLIGRELVKNIIPVHVSLTNSWTLDRKIVRCSLVEKGILADEETIFLPKKAITGPNLELEARLFRYYVVVGKQYIVPMIGRISHISSDPAKQVLYPETSKEPDEKEFRAHGLHREEPYFYKTPDVVDGFDVFEVMKQRRLATV